MTDDCEGRRILDVNGQRGEWNAARRGDVEMQSEGRELKCCDGGDVGGLVRVAGVCIMGCVVRDGVWQYWGIELVDRWIWGLCE